MKLAESLRPPMRGAVVGCPLAGTKFVVDSEPYFSKESGKIVMGVSCCHAKGIITQTVAGTYYPKYPVQLQRVCHQCVGENVRIGARGRGGLDDESGSMVVARMNALRDWVPGGRVDGFFGSGEWRII